MISGSSDHDPHQVNQSYNEVLGPSSSGSSHGSETQLSSFMSNLSILKEKVNQVQSYAIDLYPPMNQDDSISSIALANIGTMIQEIIMTASSMMFNCQQIGLNSPHQDNNQNENHIDSFLDGDNNWYNWCVDNITTAAAATTDNTAMGLADHTRPTEKEIEGVAYDIVELDATNLLAKYTHYCQICGKGFKRDANLRMHMRAHGDEYKSKACLTNPMKKITNLECIRRRKYSCPHEGCRWNKKHVKFQPLKSIICVKNHYKRSHCPKMYVCKRCNRKKFSVVSDLRTHEKHCGDVKWQCSCGTTFSRKDKLMGHVGLFIGHTPIVNTLDSKLDESHFGVQFQFKDDDS